MERFIEGDIVVISFPFSDLTGLKKRPSLVLKKIAGNDLILCQITRKPFQKSEEILISNEDFIEGSLKKDSYIRFTKLFTADESLILYKLGRISSEKLNEIIKNLYSYLIESSKLI